jgi:hypothetical protein
MSLLRTLFLWPVGLVLLGGCDTTASIGPNSSNAILEFFYPNPVVADANSVVADAIPEDKINSEPRRIAAEGIRHLDNGELDAALSAFNKALSLNTANSTLNFLAGLTYHLMALNGSDAKFALAKHGYDRAIGLDRSNWPAFYHAGLLELDLRNYKAAQNRFAEAILLNSRDPDLLYNMAVASYYAGDAPLAEGLLRQLRKLEPDSERTQRASAMTFAALGDIEAANNFVLKHVALGNEGDVQGKLANRVVDWQRWHRFRAQNSNLLAEVENVSQHLPTPEAPIKLTPEPGWQDTGDDTAVGPKAAPVKKVVEEKIKKDSDKSVSPKIDANQMVIVDAVIIRTEETNTTKKGVNLLDNLTLEFGSSNTGGGYQVTNTRSKVIGSVTRAITKAITIPSITYAINIANASDNRTEILARPTLVATNGKKSSFFSGVSIKASTLSSSAGGSGDAISIAEDVGVTLTITPSILSDGRVSIVLDLERTFLNTPDSDISGFTSTLETTKTTVSADVTMHFDETLILSGLSEKEIEKTSSGVPFLQELPIIQYFFSADTSTDFNRSILVLITPRNPEYIYEKGVTDAARPGDNSALTAFRARYADWFRPYPNWASIFNHMQENSLFREFRTGDVKLERWETKSNRSNRLKQALDFLYF